MGKKTLLEEVMLFVLGLVSKSETKIEVEESEEKPKIKRRKRKKAKRYGIISKQKISAPQKEELSQSTPQLESIPKTTEEKTEEEKE